MDLAVIAVSLNDLSDDTKNAITVATLGSSDDLKLGEPVIAIGNALGYGQSVTNGIVSALNREITLETALPVWRRLYRYFHPDQRSHQPR